MDIVRYILMGIYCIICLGKFFMGASANNFYEKNKGKTNEGKMKIATVILMILFAVLTLTLGILYVM